MAHVYKWRRGNLGVTIRPEFVDDADPPVAVDISAYTTAQRIIVKEPGGVELTRAAAFNTDGTDGKLVYTTIVADSPITGPAGEYLFIGQVEKPDGTIIDANPVRVEVG